MLSDADQFYDFIESAQNTAMTAFEATGQLYGSHVVPGGCTDVRRSRIVRTSTGFHCETCDWYSPNERETARITHLKTADNGWVAVETALRFFHVLDPKRAGVYFTCPQHMSKMYESVAQVAGHIQKHHAASEFHNVLRQN